VPPRYLSAHTGRGADNAAKPASGEITVEVDLPGDTTFVLADARQLDRVLLKSPVERDQVQRRRWARDRFHMRLDAAVAIVVTDTGVGVPADEQSRLFTPFFRSSVAIQRAVPGTGLGLVIVRTSSIAMEEPSIFGLYPAREPPSLSPCPSRRTGLRAHWPENTNKEHDHAIDPDHRRRPGHP